MADGEDLSEASEPSTTCNGGLGVLTTMVVVKATTSACLRLRYYRFACRLSQKVKSGAKNERHCPVGTDKMSAKTKREAYRCFFCGNGILYVDDMYRRYNIIPMYAPPP